MTVLQPSLRGVREVAPQRVPTRGAPWREPGLMPGQAPGPKMELGQAAAEAEASGQVAGQVVGEVVEAFPGEQAAEEELGQAAVRQRGQWVAQRPRVAPGEVVAHRA